MNLCSDSEANYTVKDDIEDNLEVENTNAVKNILSQLNDNDKRKKYKYRVVFQGNNVVNESWETALFQNMGSSPATMEAGKICDMVGCYPD